MGKGRVSAEEMELRLAETARLLVRRRSYVDVERDLANRFGVDARTARKWIRKVKDRWRAEADVEGQDDARVDLVQQLDAVLAAAWTNMVIVKDKEGNPILDENPVLANGAPNPGYKKPLVRNEPKVQHILHAVSQLRAIKGVDRPAKAHVTLDGDINVMPDVAALPEEVAKQLRAELEKLSPDGKLSTLAGEWMRQTPGVEK